MQSNVISVRFDDEMLKKLDKFCEEEDRNRVNAIRRFVKLGLMAAEKENTVDYL